jgi:hypothetical protein
VFVLGSSEFNDSATRSGNEAFVTFNFNLIFFGRHIWGSKCRTFIFDSFFKCKVYLDQGEAQFDEPTKLFITSIHLNNAPDET